MEPIQDKHTRERGATAVEYAMVAGGVAMLIFAAVGIYGTELAAYFAGLYAAVFTP